MANLLKKIIDSENLPEIIEKVINNIYVSGPVNRSDLEILALINYFNPQFFEQYQ